MNLKRKNRPLSIPIKIFIFLSLLTYLSIGFSYGVNYLYLEKYQISQRKNILIDLSRKYKRIPRDEFNKFLEEEGIFFKMDTMENLNSLRETSPNIIKSFVLKDSFIGIVKGRDKINRIILIKRTGKNSVIILGSPVASITSVLHISFKFYLLLILISIPLNLVLAYFLSMKMGKPIEEELLQLNKKLTLELEKEKKLDKFRKKFISNISHELKTPISIISGYSDAVIDGIIQEEDVIDICKNINLEASNMDNLIRELLFYTKLESRYISLHNENINLKDLLENLISRYSLDFQMKNLKINASLENITLKTDIKLFQRAINNILTNAITYVDDRKEIHIIITNEYLLIKNSYENNGNIDFQEYFTPFSGRKNVPNQKYGGTGLGLSIVSEILNTLGFKYEFLFDKKDKYAVFKIIFSQ